MKSVARTRSSLLLALATLGGGMAAVAAEPMVLINHNANNRNFRFSSVPSPVENDTGAKARFSIIRGTRDNNGGEIEALNDGQLPGTMDSPAQNLFFVGETWILADLGQPTELKRIGTYSCHTDERAPQVYTVWGAERAPQSGWQSVSERTPGLRRLARVDTRQQRGGPDHSRGAGGQYGVAIVPGAQDSSLGTFRYLLFKIEPTGKSPFAHTFYSEIDIVSASDTDLKTPEPKVFNFYSDDGFFHFTLDCSNAPELAEWGKEKIIPLVKTWYPRLTRELASDGFRPTRRFSICIRDGLGGTPAYAAGNEIHVNRGWLRGEKDREGLGCIVHEMAHVVQSYNRRQPPGWVSEGLADYVRWFLYEPQSKGAKVRQRDAVHDASYRVTANFLDFVIRKHDPEFLKHLNAAAREGRYREDIWKERTGKTRLELAEEWKAQLPR